MELDVTNNRIHPQRRRRDDTMSTVRKIVGISAVPFWLAFGAGHANATPADVAAVDNYLYSLRIAGVNIEGHRESLLQVGFTVCDDLRAGLGERGEVVALMGRGYGPNTAAAVVNSAELDLCTTEENLPAE
jgi:Protein of unknown function (DUF732)